MPRLYIRTLLGCSAALLAIAGPLAGSAGATTISVSAATNLASPGQLVHVTVTEPPAGQWEIVEAARGSGYDRCNFKAGLAGASNPTSLDIYVKDQLGSEGAAAGGYGAGCVTSDQTLVPCTNVAGQRSCALEVRRVGDAAALASTPISFGPWCDDIAVDVDTSGRRAIDPLPCWDPEGRPLTVAIVEAPHNGTLGAPDAADRRLYVAQEAAGGDTFKFQADNGVRASNVALARLNVRFRGANSPPIAKPDKWVVQPGFNIDDTVLRNDYDPDGDAITARVIKISFASKEWSKMDPDGRFLYVAGPGTKRTLHKTITYVAVDAQGNTSAPTTAVVTIARPHAAKSPLGGKRHAAKAATAGVVWLGPSAARQTLCFGYGLNASCFTMLSVRNTHSLNLYTGWTNRTGAVQACLQYGFIPMKNADCAQALLTRTAGQIWNKGVIHTAAGLGYCLMFRVERNRTLAHPRAGEWGKPQYFSDDSPTRPYDGNTDRSGYGYWLRDGGFTLKHMRVPLFCNAQGLVFRRVYQPLVSVD
jgi:hypothetical protein